MSEKEVRIPKQQRSIEKKNQIKNAAIALISEKGYHKTSSNEIARKAGVSIGTFYSYYADKTALYEDLVMDLYDDVLNQIPEMDLTKVTNPVDLVRNYIRIVMAGHAYMPAFQKEVTCLSQQYDHFHELEEKSRSHATEKIFRLMMENRELLRITDFEIAGLLIQNALEAVIHQVQFYPNDYDKEKVIDELTDMLCRYVFKPEYLLPS